MSIDASRIEKVEVEFTVPVVEASVEGARTIRNTSAYLVLREKDAITLAHSLAGSLGYELVKRS